MKKEIKKFIKKNKIKLNNKNSKKKILLTDRIREDAIFANSLSAFIYNKYFSLDVDLLTELRENSDYIKLYKSFNIKNIIYLSISQMSFRKLIFLLKTLTHTLLVISKILFFGSNWFVKNFTIKGVYFGDIFYDTYIRRYKGFLNDNLINPKFIKILIIGIYKIYFIDRVFKNNEYSLVVCNTHIYTSNSAITMRLALKKKISVLMIVSNYFRFYDKLDQAYYQYINIQKKDLIINSKKYNNWKKKFNFWLKKRFSGKLLQRDASIAFSKNKVDVFELLKLKKIDLKKFKRIGFFAPHAFSDANYASGRFLFLSYYDQFKRTIEILKEEKEIFWFINPHPNSTLYKEDKIIKNFIKEKKIKNFIICPKKTNTNDLLKISDIILTGRGTAGIEAACIGKKPILAGPSYYSSCGFTHNPKNFEEYKRLILNKKSDYRLKKKQIDTAKKTFYTWIFKNSHVNSNIFPISQFIDVDLKKKKLIQNHYYGSDFLDKINKNLEKYSLMKDAFYMGLKNFITQNKNLIR